MATGINPFNRPPLAIAVSDGATPAGPENAPATSADNPVMPPAMQRFAMGRADVYQLEENELGPRFLRDRAREPMRFYSGAGRRDRDVNYEDVRENPAANSLHSLAIADAYEKMGVIEDGLHKIGQHLNIPMGSEADDRERANAKSGQCLKQVRVFCHLIKTFY